MKIAVPKETHADERRVACTPASAAQLVRLGHRVLTERGAGFAAGFTDPDYTAAGATVVDDADALWSQAELVCKVRPPTTDEVEKLTDAQTLISFFWPAQNQKLLQQVAARGATALAMDAVPRISRAQNMDALSSMANIAGYRAVVEAAQHFGRFFNGQITAAGKVPPATVLVIGAGVAGLSAIGAAVSLGAVVRAFDTRLEVKEQIESLNAEFLELNFDEDGGGEGGYAKVMSDEFLKAEMKLFAEQAREVDIIITTALVPGKPAPKLITAPMVASMKTGGVIVDLAAEQGGNCELTTPGKVTKQHGVSVIGYTDLAGRMAAQASELYAANLQHLIKAVSGDPGSESGASDGSLALDMDDEVIRAVTVAHGGKVTWPPPASPSPLPSPSATPSPSPSAPTVPPSAPPSRWLTPTLAAVAAAATLALGAVAPPSFMQHFIVFILACFVGWQVVWKVTPALHTPLMSVTNAISSIIVIGALLQTDSHWSALAFVALLLASVNIAGGFLVTQRMLRMFKK